MKTMTQDTWMRRGISLLWDPHLLLRIAAPDQIRTLHEFFVMSASWPDDLPAGGGSALVVVGVEGCLDVLSPADALTWLETDLRARVLEFQDSYQGAAALILWFPSGRKRMDMVTSSEEYIWRPVHGPGSSAIPIGRCLFGGAESDVERLMNSEVRDTNLDGAGYAGLYISRIS